MYNSGRVGMSEDREKLLKIMSSLEDDYKSGKISAEKYSYFRSKYEDKLNSIDAKAATRRIRSMQGKSSTNAQKKRRKKPTKNKKKEEQDLVQKYIINPKKSDSKYNKKDKSSMDSGTFKLLLLLILVIGFTAGTAYGIFNLDFGAITDSETVAVVDDTAFPEFKEDVKLNNTTTVQTTYNNSYSNYDNNANDDIETTTDDSSDAYDSSYDNQQSQQQGSQSSQSQSSSDSGSSSQSGSQNDGDG